MVEQPRLVGKVMPFEEVSEGWNEYNLADGNTLLIKIVLLKVLKTDQKNPAGEPIYSFQTHLISNVYTKEQGYVRSMR